MKLMIALLAAILTSSLAYADNYSDLIVKTTLVRPTESRIVAVVSGYVPDIESGKDVPVYTDTTVTEPVPYASLKLDLPFNIYSQEIISLGKDVTYNLHDYSHEGIEVIAKISVKNADYEKAKQYVGTIGDDWTTIKADKAFTKHWTLTKADALATSAVDSKTGEIVVTKYDKADKAELVPFTSMRYKGDKYVIDADPILDPIDIKQ